MDVVVSSGNQKLGDTRPVESKTISVRRRSEISFHAFNVARDRVRDFLVLVNQTDDLGGNRVIAVDLIDEIGYVVSIRRKFSCPIVLAKLRDFERSNGWALDQ